MTRLATPHDAAAIASIHRSVVEDRAIGYKLGEWPDVGWWRVELTEPTEPPAEPLPLADLVRHPVWPDLLEAGEAFLR